MKIRGFHAKPGDHLKEWLESILVNILQGCKCLNRTGEKMIIISTQMFHRICSLIKSENNKQFPVR